LTSGEKTAEAFKHGLYFTGDKATFDKDGYWWFVGVPDPNRHQLVKAFVILSQGQAPSRELALELFQHTIEVLAKFKIPRIIEFVEELPKTISGKICRINLARYRADF